MIDEQTKQLIEQYPLALATSNKDGTPNVIAVAYVKTAGTEKIVITDNYMEQTRKNIQHNPAVCLAVWDEDWHGAKLVGTAEYHADGAWHEFVKAMDENKGEACNGAIVVTIKNIIRLG